jgi:hypothetical protein
MWFNTVVSNHVNSIHVPSFSLRLGELKKERIQIIREVEMLAQRESDELYAREHPH